MYVNRFHRYTQPSSCVTGCVGSVIYWSFFKLYEFRFSSRHSLLTCLSIGIANFFVGLIFLPLRNFLSGASHDKDGRVFYLFAFILALSMGVLSRVYRG